MEAPRTEEPIYEQVKTVAGNAKSGPIYGIAQAGIAIILGIVALKAAKYAGASAYVFAAIAFSLPAFLIVSAAIKVLSHCRIKIRW